MKRILMLLLAVVLCFGVLTVEAEAAADVPSTSTAKYLTNDKYVTGRVTSEVRYYLDDTNTRVPIYGSNWYYFSLMEESYGWVSVVCDSAKTDYTVMRSDGTYYSHFDTLGAGIYFLRVESEKNGAEYELILKFRPVSKLKDYYGSSCPHNNGHYEVRSNGTCVTPGKKQWNCSDCSFTYLETFWGDHAAGEWTVTKEAASCAEKGLETSACTLCGEYMEREISAGPHVFKEKTLSCAPDLRYGGSYSGFCINCNTEATNKIPKVENASAGFVMDADVVHIGERAFFDPSSNYNYDYLTSVTLPESVTSIGEYAFYGCKNLTSVTLPESLTGIGSYAFYGCKSLTGITIPKGVTMIENDVFHGCESLTGVTIPESVTAIGSEAFAGCKKLTRVNFEAGKATVYADAFDDCSNLAEVHSPSLEAWFGLTFVESGNELSPMRPGKDLYIGGELLTEAVIPEGITAIPTGAFYNYGSLTSVTLAKSVRSVGDYAFYACYDLNTVAMPGCVEEIGEYAFGSCTKLTGIFLPEGLRYIGSYAFRGCNHLLSITIPQSVTGIGLNAFMDCDDLARVYFLGDAPDGWSGSNAPFYDCGSGVSAYYPAGNSTWTLEAMSELGRSMTWRSCCHQFDDNAPCDAVAAYCVSCKAGRAYAHTYESATCTKPGSCTGCGLKVSEALGHRYDDDADTDCNRCGKKRGEAAKPAAPEITGSNAAASGKPKLTWKAVDGAVKYEIWRSTKQNSGFSKIHTQKGTTYTNTKAVAGTKYYYKVKAVDSEGNVSDFSNRVGRMCDLARPTNLKTSNVLSSGKIKLTWKAVDGAKSYKVYRATSQNGKYTLMKTVTGTTYTNTSAKAGTKYFYKVMAVHENTNANSAYSVIVSRMADLARPVITVKRNDAGKPRISWKKVEGAVKYEVWRSTSKNGKYTKIATTRNLYQVNKNAKAGVTYYYKVKAVHSNTNANSALSLPKYIKAK